MGEFSIGQSVRRREDPRLLTGRGRYFDDLKLADQFHAAIVRSPHAHADIKSIDTRAALQMPGVHAVLTGKDYRGRRPRHDAVDGALQEARRQPDVPAAPAGDRDRPRAACRLSGRGGGRRYARSGARCRRARRGRLCAASRGGVGARGVRARRAAALRRLPEQRGVFLPGRRQGRDRRGVRQRRPCHRAAPGHQPRHRQSRSSRAASPANTTAAPAATRCIAASSGRGCSATPSPKPR